MARQIAREHREQGRQARISDSERRSITLSRLSAFLTQERHIALAVALTVLRLPEDANDAVQEAAARATMAAEIYDPSKPFAPWFKRIVLSVCLEWINRNSKHRPQVCTIDARGADGESGELDFLADVVSDPRAERAFDVALCDLFDHGFNGALESLDLAVALASLDAHDKELFIALYLNDDGIAAIAKRLGLNDRTFRRRKERARENLRVALGRVQKQSERSTAALSAVSSAVSCVVSSVARQGKGK